MLWINTLIPLALIEASHFAGSVFGVGLVVLARGLWLKIRLAYILTITLLILGSLVSLLKGFDYEEALLLTFSAIALFMSRRKFYRSEDLPSVLSNPTWLLLAGGALIGTTWLMFFAHKHVEYNNQLWWQFAIDGHASRALRALAGAAVVFSGIALNALLRPQRNLSDGPSAEDLSKVLPIVRASHETYPWLALLGDKEFLFSASGRTFLMFAPQGKSLIALGDPVGDSAEYSELCWRFHELADQQGLRTVFYQVGPQHLTNYIDLGLTLLKLGEEARVNVQNFSMEGGKRRNQRNSLKKLESEGVELEVVEAARVPELLPELKRTSDDWLEKKHAREKGFSLGRFVPDYVSKTPCAVLRVKGTLCAFSNLWLCDSKDEFSVDMMRYHEDAPKGVMEFLFLKLILWGKQQGYRHFGLGMAPLSGLETHPLAPLWHRVGAKVFQHGEHFYNFQGLRLYKEKFDPEWVPRYLASPGGLALPGVVANITSRISGGFRGVLVK